MVGRVGNSHYNFWKAQYLHLISYYSQKGVWEHSHGFFAQKPCECSRRHVDSNTFYITFSSIMKAWSRGKYTCLLPRDRGFETHQSQIFFFNFSFSKRCGKITFKEPTGPKMHSTCCGPYKPLISGENGTYSLISVFSTNCGMPILKLFLMKLKITHSQ